MIVTLHRDRDKICLGYSSRRKYSSDDTNMFCRVVNKLLKDKRNKLSKAKLNKILGGFRNGYISLSINQDEEDIKLYTYKDVRDSKVEIDLNITSRFKEPEVIVIKTMKDLELDEEGYKLFIDVSKEIVGLEGFNLDNLLSNNLDRKNIKVEVSTESLNIANI